MRVIESALMAQVYVEVFSGSSTVSLPFEVVLSSVSGSASMFNSTIILLVAN